MQICTSLQTITMSASHHSVFLQAGCPSCRPTNSVKALKAICLNESVYMELHIAVTMLSCCLLQLEKLVDGLGLNVHSISESDTKKILSQVQPETLCASQDNDVSSATRSQQSTPPPPPPPLPSQKTPCKAAVTRISCSWLKKTLDK